MTRIFVDAQTQEKMIITIHGNIKDMHTYILIMNVHCGHLALPQVAALAI